MKHILSTDPYKGTRDFYPEDMAVQRYIFDTWAKTAEVFGYERYDASTLEPSELYKSKGAENEEMVSEQTYTFTDRGDREVTLRPEITPTIARMVAGRRRELSVPIRWYSIPNLYRYERTQRGRLREFWQLNCDIFGVTDTSADVEIITLTHSLLTAFGATNDMFEIRINSRKLMHEQVTSALKSPELFPAYLALIDRKAKISTKEFNDAESELLKEDVELLITPDEDVQKILSDLRALGVTNAVFDPSITRGFNYYTGTVFEVFDTSGENNRSMLGGGRFDNLTEMFGGEAISGIGFGMGDVVMHDFLVTHGLLEGKVPSTSATLVIIPENDSLNLEGEKIAQEFRNAGIRTSVDISSRKLDKKKVSAEKNGSRFMLVVEESHVSSGAFTLKSLIEKSESHGSISELITKI